MKILDAVFSALNVDQAVHSINKNSSPGIDGISMERSIETFQSNRNSLFESIKNGSYRPSAAQRVYIEVGDKKRPIDLLTGQDRIIQRLFAQVLANQYEPEFSNFSHGFRSGRGRHSAARQIIGFFEEGGEFALQLDISKYFQNVDHSLLMNMLERKVDEPAVRQFIQKCLVAGYYENGHFFNPESGIPQGSPLSPVLSNVYLNELDKELETKGISFIRFADDVAIITKTRNEAEEILHYLQEWLPNTLSLPLSTEKTKIVPAAKCRILGYQFALTEDQRWKSDPPLPAEHQTTQDNKKGTKESSVSAIKGKIISSNVNPALLDLKGTELNEQLNRWMPKAEADQIKKAVLSEFSVVEVAQAMGFTVVFHSSDTLSLVEHDSCIIWPATNRFKRYSVTDKNGRAIGGTPFDFYLHFSKATYMQALNVFKKLLTGRPEKGQFKHVEHPKPLDLTPMERDMLLKDEFFKRNVGKNRINKVFAYLIQTRKIDAEIIHEQVNRGCLQQITDDKGRTQCLFIGYDSNGLWSAACFRSTNSTNKFMGDLPGCDYNRGWFFDPQWDPRTSKVKPESHKPLLCFESYIEMLSYMTILKEKNFDYHQFSYLACGSITKNRCIDQICEEYGFNKVKVMFNNDFESERESGKNRGKQAAQQAAERLCKKGISAQALIPSQHNDWNDMLRSLKTSTPEQVKKQNSSNRDDIGR